MMRVSDSMKYRLYLQNITRVNGQIQDIETQVATGKTVNTPSDNPVTYATNVDYDAALSTISRFTSNLQGLVLLSGIYDTCLTTISDQLGTVTDLANNADTMDEGLLTAASQNVEDIIESSSMWRTPHSGTAISLAAGRRQRSFSMNNDYSVTYNVDEKVEDVTSIYFGSNRTGQYGVSGRQAFYSTSKIAYGSVDNTYKGEIYANTESFCYVMDGTNNTILLTDTGGSTSITIASGVYTGSALARRSRPSSGPTIPLPSIRRRGSLS
jgi:flagellin-like hook-associated protein FlgL